jgi:hypothetical protein
VLLRGDILIESASLVRVGDDLCELHQEEALRERFEIFPSVGGGGCVECGGSWDGSQTDQDDDQVSHRRVADVSQEASGSLLTETIRGQTSVDLCWEDPEEGFDDTCCVIEGAS